MSKRDTSPKKKVSAPKTDFDSIKSSEQKEHDAKLAEFLKLVDGVDMRLSEDEAKVVLSTMDFLVKLHHLRRLRPEEVHAFREAFLFFVKAYNEIKTPVLRIVPETIETPEGEE